MKEISFKNWLKENATTTACVATFSRPMMTLVSRPWNNDKKKKKKH